MLAKIISAGALTLLLTGGALADQPHKIYAGHSNSAQQQNPQTRSCRRLSACRGGNGQMGRAARSTGQRPVPQEALCIASEVRLRSTTSMPVTAITPPDTQPIPRRTGTDGFNDTQGSRG
jgi:hypothetical protein